MRGLNSQTWNQEALVPPTEPARHPPPQTCVGMQTKRIPSDRSQESGPCSQDESETI